MGILRRANVDLNVRGDLVDIYGRRPRFCERSLCERSARLWRRSKERKEEERDGGFRARQLHSHSRATTQRTKELDDCAGNQSEDQQEDHSKGMQKEVQLQRMHH